MSGDLDGLRPDSSTWSLFQSSFYLAILSIVLLNDKSVRIIYCTWVRRSQPNYAIPVIAHSNPAIILLFAVSQEKFRPQAWLYLILHIYVEIQIYWPKFGIFFVKSSQQIIDFIGDGRIPENTQSKTTDYVFSRTRCSEKKNILGSEDQTKLGWGFRNLCQDF